MQPAPPSRAILQWSPSRRRFVGVLLWLPIPTFALAFTLVAFAIFSARDRRLASALDYALIVIVPLLGLLFIALYAFGAIVVGRDIAQRQDMKASDKQSWLLVLYIAGPFGAPLYWQQHVPHG